MALLLPSWGCGPLCTQPWVSYKFVSIPVIFYVIYSITEYTLISMDFINIQTLKIIHSTCFWNQNFGCCRSSENTAEVIQCKLGLKFRRKSRVLILWSRSVRPQHPGNLDSSQSEIFSYLWDTPPKKNHKVVISEILSIQTPKYVF